jgi:hypothetical protein
MKTVRVLVGLLALASVSLGGWLAARDAGRPPPAGPAPQAGTPGGDNRAKIDALERQLQALKDEQHARETVAPSDP